MALVPGPVRAGDPVLVPLGKKSVSVTFMAGQTFSPSPGGFAEAVVSDLEASRFVATRLELGIELHPALWIRQPERPSGEGRQDVLAVAADLILRWYPVRLDSRIEPYFEAALGPCWSSEPVPAAGTQVNFLVQGGAGLLLRTGTRWSTVVGWRWFHLSNANLGENNPGVNFSFLLVGGRLFLP